MSNQVTTSQDERVMAAAAHASVLLGLFTSGIGGILAALVVWLVNREKSAYVAFQALQAMVYQVATFLLTTLAWCCWVGLWLLLWLPAMIANEAAYQAAPPAGMWVGMSLMILPLGFWALTILYALYGAVRTLSGHDFEYVVVGRWLRRRS